MTFVHVQAMAEGTVSQDAVGAKLMDLLKEADLHAVSERMLIASLVECFGEGVRSQHRQFVKVSSGRSCISGYKCSQ